MSKWVAQVQVKWNGKHPTDWKWLHDWKEVTWAGSTMGDWDLTLWVNVGTPDDLEKWVNKFRSQDWVSDTRSTWTREVWAA